jgi:hypothetical protein
MEKNLGFEDTTFRNIDRHRERNIEPIVSTTSSDFELAS